ncbi:serine/threonine phosphatase, putative [Leishmania donovani]|uniref:Calcineurin-like phosphoesterase family protein n=1 Tax=Leishmania donovani TaxID=5661 RepID=A0A3S7X3U9_LEIDO|nr:serine/threonine phosphatase, putative [Leishmania donovani]AYU81133.1 serine/threonine phosphatase, putative [Leishmania donovani]TPP45879.1 Calcineurin-like phosphoesterase family protein [Leishmania donovani]CBZ36354.1 serine/threonine phosphatase, putative [Leishmania donovani]
MASLWKKSLSLLLSAALIIAAFAVALSAEARRLVAVGDLHGDYEQSVSVLRLARLIDNRNHWIGEDALLVQLGDILDVGPDDILIVRLLMRLQQEAHAKGGDVIELLGNHELRNFRGDYKAVDKASLAASGGQKGRDVLLSNATDLGRYLRTRKAIFHYGPFLFMHGGFSTATAGMITSLSKVEEFNSELTKALMNGTISPLARGGLDLTEDDVDDVANPILVRSILNVKCNALSKVLDKKFPGIQSVVVGHVPHDPRDFDGWRLCGGRIIDIDFGMSRWKKGDPGHVAALEIEEATWHVQLIETSTASSSVSGTHAPFQDSVAAYYLVSFSALIVVCVASVLLAAYYLPLCSGAAREPLLKVGTNYYGTV